MRALGIDLGAKRIGVAVSDASGVLASPLATVQRRGDAPAEQADIARLVAEEDATVVVVGLPVNMDGSRGPAAQAAAAEADVLAAALPVPVEMIDERLTTVTADRALQATGRRGRDRRRVVDQTAAAVLLQSWLDGPRGRLWRGESCSPR